MPLSTGTRLGSYEIVAPLGAGGMGEVYRALDTRLKRQVAIKVLPSAVAADGARLARFQREAEVLASLNHPHIAAVYGLEDLPAGKALVMELVEGQTLADRIARAPVPIDEALAIAGQIAEALEAAHEQGIVHRDLKPANISVREDGTVKVLDFGLAKLADPGASREGDPEQSPTITSGAMTGIGIILGTAAYMSPEQARGRAVDKRTDVWAFGAVLYEMLARRRAFEGESVTDTIAAVVKSTPEWSALPPDVPPHVVTLVQRCLEKDRKLRIGDMAVARFLLTHGADLGALPSPGRIAATRASLWRRLLPVAVAAGLAGFAIGWFVPRRSTSATAPIARLQMSLSPAVALASDPYSVRPGRTAFAISPDGQTVVIAAARGDVKQLWVRSLNGTAATPLAGTEGASGPFFSPDGAAIGFWVGRTLKRVPASGGPPVTIAEVDSLGREAATWSTDGHIYVQTNDDGGRIARVPAAGGTLTDVVVRDPAKAERLLLPHVLPDGKRLLLTMMKSDEDWETAAVVIRSLDGGGERVLIPNGTDARYIPTGHILYMKTGTLMAVPFDIGSGQVTGAPVALIEGVMQAVNLTNTDVEGGAGQFAVSNTGTLIYATGGVGAMASSRLEWLDRQGKAELLETAPPAPFVGFSLSRDGQKIAAAVRRGATNRVTDIWIYDTVRGAPTRLTVDGGNYPVWSPDGRRVALRGPEPAHDRQRWRQAGTGGRERHTLPIVMGSGNERARVHGVHRGPAFVDRRHEQAPVDAAALARYAVCGVARGPLAGWAADDLRLERVGRCRDLRAADRGNRRARARVARRRDRSVVVGRRSRASVLVVHPRGIASQTAAVLGRDPFGCAVSLRRTASGARNYRAVRPLVARSELGGQPRRQALPDAIVRGAPGGPVPSRPCRSS